MRSSSSRSFHRPVGSCTRAARRGALVLAVACGMQVPHAAHADGRLVRVTAILPHPQPVATDLALTGTIQARIQSNVAFRTGGKVTARQAEVGSHVAADAVLATLDPTEQRADVDNAQAALDSARAQVQQAQLNFARQQSLIASGFTTRASFDQAESALNTAKAQQAVASATLDTAREQLSYADLKAGQAGVIVSREVEAGQVVQAGQTVFVLAQDGPRDAVFDVPEALLTAPPRDRQVDVTLEADPGVRTTGSVREVSPILDASTSTVRVKIGLDRAPPAMTLGAAVIGRAHWEQRPAVLLPWSALFETDGKPAVWVLGADDTVSLRPVVVRGYATGAVVLAEGLDGAVRVVTAGIQLLYPGQKVAVVEGAAP